MPYVSYNNIYLGKKLDIGVASAFEVTLGNPTSSCENAIKTVTGVPPALLLQDTPLILRRVPFGATATSQSIGGTLTLQSFPLLQVNRVEVGKVGREGGLDSGKLSPKDTPIDDAIIQLGNLVLGSSGSFDINSLTANNVDSTVTLQVNGEEFTFPSCPSGARWQQLEFGATTLTDRKYDVLTCPDPPASDRVD